jgi:hypothetical protein
MTGIKDVTGTAFVVAEFRAQESTEAEPLYVDPIVPIFLDARTKQAADAISSGFPAAGMNVRIRTRYLTTGWTSSSPAAAGRSSFLVQGSTRGPCASNRPRSSISKLMT